MLDRIRSFVDAANKMGLTKKSLALPAPSLALLSSPDTSELTDDLVFKKLITEDEIHSVCYDLFVSQFYNNAVQEAFKALDSFIVEFTNIKSESGVSLMRKVFDKKKPCLVFSKRENQSEKDEHEGYGHIFAGSMQGIRNPTSHEFQWINDRETALECLVLCQHLLRKAKAAKPPEQKDESKSIL